MFNLSWSSRSCLVKPVLGWQQGRLACMVLREWSKSQRYFCIMQAMRRVEHLEIPAAQWTSTLVLRRAFSMKSQAGAKVWRASCVWQSLRSNLRWRKCEGYWKCRSTPEQTAPILFFYSSLVLCANSQPLIHTSPSSPSLGSTRCPLLQKGPNVNIQIIQLLPPSLAPSRNRLTDQAELGQLLDDCRRRQGAGGRKGGGNWLLLVYNKLVIEDDRRKVFARGRRGSQRKIGRFGRPTAGEREGGSTGAGRAGRRQREGIRERQQFDHPVVGPRGSHYRSLRDAAGVARGDGGRGGGRAVAGGAGGGSGGGRVAKSSRGAALPAGRPQEGAGLTASQIYCRVQSLEGCPTLLSRMLIVIAFYSLTPVWANPRGKSPSPGGGAAAGCSWSLGWAGEAASGVGPNWEILQAKQHSSC